MIWGLTSGGWMSGLVHSAADRYRAHLDLLREHDLHATEWGADALLEMPAGRREELAGWLEEQDVRTALWMGFDYFAADPGEARRGADAMLQALEELPGPMRARMCSTGIPRTYHHYSHDLPVAEQVERLAEVLAPLAAAAHRAGCPLAIHKVSHFGADLADLCRQTPHLGILLDTGNAFLIGELPVVGAEAAAPHVVGTHFKDHYVEPGFCPLSLKVRGAVPGEGDAELRRIHEILQRRAPRPDELLMLLEIDPVEGLTQREALRRAVDFVHSLG